MALVSGAQYLRNKVTGAVFPYRERISTLPNMELLEADDNGELVKVGRDTPPSELNPTKTPEKKSEEKKVTEPAKPATTPTLAPVVEK